MDRGLREAKPSVLPLESFIFKYYDDMFLFSILPGTRNQHVCKS
jgi:hypothetical protein